tara:strand:- start:12878 stop:13303 length:426 start_codon:yes stop_codon:yes gene_type:complete
MAFPSNNAISHGNQVSVVAVVGDTQNWYKVPAVVDVTGMEFTFGTSTTKAADASTSIFTAVANDGATTGVGTSALFTALTNASIGASNAWTDITVRNVAGSSTTDLDADDVVNLVTTTAGTAITGFTAAVAYIYGKPGTIN